MQRDFAVLRVTVEEGRKLKGADPDGVINPYVTAALSQGTFGVESPIEKDGAGEGGEEDDTNGGLLLRLGAENDGGAAAAVDEDLMNQIK
eukprot:4935005-Pyramimonas_sp.AAC.1